MLTYDEWVSKKGIKLETKMLKFMDKVPYFLSEDIRVKLMDDLPMEKYCTKFLKEQYALYVKDKKIQKSLKKVSRLSKILIPSATYKASMNCYISDNIEINGVRYRGTIEASSSIDLDGDVLRIAKIEKDNVLHCISVCRTDILVVINNIVKGK